MNNDIIAGKWHQVKGEIKRQWGRLTDDQLTEAEGSREKLAGHVQSVYGIARDEAERQIDAWQRSIEKEKTDAL